MAAEPCRWTIRGPAGLDWAREPCREVACPGLLELEPIHELQGTHLYHRGELDAKTWLPSDWEPIIVSLTIRAWLEHLHTQSA